MHEAGTVSPLCLRLSQAKPMSLHLHTFVAWQSSDGVIRKMINNVMCTHLPALRGNIYVPGMSLFNVILGADSGFEA